MAAPTPSDIAAKIAKLRASAKDTSIPQDIRNQFLDKANELEKSTYKPTMAKGGAVMEKATGEKYGSKKAMAKHEKGEGKAMQMKEKSKSALAIVIGVGKPKAMMNKGGMAKKGKC
jgi:hypothetical protein